jgi:hypothetical protein
MGIRLKRDGLQSLREIYVFGFVSGPDFSRAVKGGKK